MAENLYVAPSTVRTQVKSIYRKLGVSSRKDAVEEAHARGLT
jgi:LuxR family maltose regulon positive regulatory protein